MAATPEAVSWVTTLIQVGIPSLVTVVSMIFTFRIGKASHEKDKSIATLAADNERWKMASERKMALIRDVTSALTELENAHGTYSGVFRRDRMRDASASIVQSKELGDAFILLSAAVDKCCGARMAVGLLGDHNISLLFEAYLGLNFAFQNLGNPSSSASPIDLNNSFEEMKVVRIELVRLLSNLHLDSTVSAVKS